MGRNATQHYTTQHNTTQHNTTQHNTTQHNTTRSWFCLSGLAMLALPAEAGEYPKDTPAPQGFHDGWQCVLQLYGPGSKIKPENLMARYQEVQQNAHADKAKQRDKRGELQWG